MASPKSLSETGFSRHQHGGSQSEANLGIKVLSKLYKSTGTQALFCPFTLFNRFKFWCRQGMGSLEKEIQAWLS